MNQQLLNPKTGEFAINKDFVVSAKTTIEELLANFGEGILQVQNFENGHSNYTIRNLKIGELYFILTFYFTGRIISKIQILVQELTYEENASWDDFNEEEEIKKGNFIKLWFQGQIQKDYKKYDWGKADVYYDFHNFSTSCSIIYDSK